MREEELHLALAYAREHKSNKRFSEAVKCYEAIYGTYANGCPQYYDYHHHYAIYQNYLNSQPCIVADEEPTPFVRDWKIERVFYFNEIVAEFTECLLYSNNPEFELEKSEVFNRMTSYNTTFECKRKNGANYPVAKDSYPFTLRMLSFKHIFKSGTWKDMTLWEVELAAPEKILSMVLSVPTSSSDSKLDLAIHQQFFLSKYRNRNKIFYTALEVNYSKMAAVAEWEHREMMEEIKYDNQDYAYEMKEVSHEEIIEAAEDELQAMRDETDGFSDWNMDK